ncbi:STAS domain-containing protein [methane-oxidizing endosymbiont of Gigantopelta aegis]|uniref:STAS domain-containing protein n=1 Tax=methane-oxidizing endosymbiont of Gigantopelta aegis TaxID=2794938 RepID=UPI0018DE82B3|nr:STAS domain-containing protein [methane-oxidizing endosymbiont of Gigantopelta aegis]
MSDEYPIPDDLVEKFAQAENWQANTEQEDERMAATIEEAPKTEIGNAKNQKIAERIANILNTKEEKDTLATNQEEREFSGLETEKTYSTPKKIALSHKQTIEDVTTLRQTILAALDRDADIEVDASAVMRIDTATLQLLLACKQTANQSGKGFLIKSPSERFINAIELLGMKELLNLADSSE